MNATDELVDAVRGGDRRALAQAITLVESSRTDHREQALAVLDAVLPSTGGAIRLGITGPPGVGKSTLIERLGLDLVDQGRQVAVLAVDPSSIRSGGSILGDKTRMPDLARADRAFIRPSPSGGSLGGIARRTREALLLCEAAGYDVVIVETVGVGQSETAVADVVDLFLLLAAPGAGDELQGIKRGIMELADLIAVNKADGDQAAAAEASCMGYRQVVGLLRPKRPGWQLPVMTVSAVTGQGIAELWEAVVAQHDALRESGLEALRADQAAAWMWHELHDTVSDRVRDATDASALEARVRSGELAPAVAAAQLVAALLDGETVAQGDGGSSGPM